MYLNIWDSLAWKRLFCVTQFDMIPPLLCFGREKEWPLLFLWGRRIFSDWMHSFCLFLLLKAVLKTDYLSPNSGDMWFDFIVWSWRYVLHVSFIVNCWFSLTWSDAMFFNRNKRESLRMNGTPWGFVWNTKMAAVSLFGGIITVVVASCENQEYVVVLVICYTVIEYEFSLLGMHTHVPRIFCIEFAWW